MRLWTIQKALVILIMGLPVAIAAESTVSEGTDSWAINSKTLSLSRHSINDTLQARGLDVSALKPQQRSLLLKELFIRESLIQSAKNIPGESLELLEKRVAEYRAEQLSRLALESLAREKMPDFTKRARELYEAHKASKYHLPLRLRVRVIERYVAKKDPTAVQVILTELQQLKKNIQLGDLDFKQAVSQYSDAANKTLTKGDSHWFHAAQKPQVFFLRASQLSDDEPLSDAFIVNDKVYLLKLLGRKAARQRPFAEVEASIIDELTRSYLEEQRKILLENLQTRFENEVTIHPDFL